MSKEYNANLLESIRENLIKGREKIEVLIDATNGGFLEEEDFESFHAIAEMAYSYCVKSIIDIAEVTNIFHESRDEAIPFSHNLPQ